jgi:tetratricopeptide (TPR) repeat protein
MYALEFRVFVPRGDIPTQPQPRSSPANPEGEFLMTKVRLCMLILTLVALAALSSCRSAHTTSAILYIDEQDYQKAVDVIDEGLSYDPDDAEAYFWQGEAYSHMAEKAIIDNDFEKAKTSYGLAYEKYSTAKQMDPEGLSDQIRESLEINYTNRMRSGDQMWQGRYYEQAEGFYRLAYAACPDSATPLRNIANLKMSQAASAPKDSATVLMTDALTFLDAYVVREPQVYKARADKAYALTYLDRLDEAKVLYDELLGTHGDDPELLSDVVGFARQRQDYKWAADLNVKIAEIYNGDTNSDNDDKVVPLLTEAGNWYASANVKAYPEALAALDRASELDPSNSELLFFRLRTFFFYGQDLEIAASKAPEPEQPALMNQAKQMFQRGVDIGNALVASATTNAEGFRYLGLCQARLGDSAAAEQNLKTSEQLSSGGGS